MGWSLWGNGGKKESENEGPAQQAEVPDEASPFFEGPYRTGLWLLTSAIGGSLYFQLTNSGYGGIVGFGVPMLLWLAGVYALYDQGARGKPAD